LPRKNPNKPSPGKRDSALELNAQQSPAKSARQINAAKNPEITPWTIKGPRIN